MQEPIQPRIEVHSWYRMKQVSNISPTGSVSSWQCGSNQKGMDGWESFIPFSHNQAPKWHRKIYSSEVKPTYTWHWMKQQSNIRPSVSHLWCGSNRTDTHQLQELFSPLSLETNTKISYDLASLPHSCLFISEFYHSCSLLTKSSLTRLNGVIRNGGNSPIGAFHSTRSLNHRFRID